MSRFLSLARLSWFAGALLLAASLAHAQEPAATEAPAPELSAPEAAATDDGSSTPEEAPESAAPDATAEPSATPDTAAAAASVKQGTDTPAETPSALAAAIPVAPSATQLDDLVVTATKRASPVRSIPATVSVLSGEDLEREGVQGIDQIVALVPGVNLTDDGQGNPKRVTIRGISADVNANFTAGTLLGDIPFSDPFVPKVQLDPNPFDMATVEILKGPQGTLFGGSGLNGMIRYVPEAPELDATRVKYFSQYSSYPGNGDHGWSYGAVLNAPFLDNTAAVRLMGFRRESPGFVDDTQSGKPDINSVTQYGVRGMAAWHPDENWRLSLLLTTQHTKQADVAFTDNSDGHLRRGNTPRPSPIESSYTLGNLGLERTYTWGDFVSQTSLFDKKFDAFLDASRIALGGREPLLSAVGTNHSKGLSQEVRFVSAPDDESAWKWLGGGFYYDAHLDDCAEAGAASGLPGLPLPGALQGLLATPCKGNRDKIGDELDVAQLLADIDIREEALFGELTRAFGDDWEATLGARGYRTESGGTVSNSGALYSAQNLGQPGQHDATIVERGVSPKATLAYHPTRDLRTYFTASKGFRFGGAQLGASTPTTKVPPVYKSDTLWNYELGVRSDWLNQSLRIDASLYHIDWTHPQISQQSSDTLVTFIDNVGGVKGDGIDLSARYLVPFLPGVSLNSSLSWNRTRTTTPFTAANGTDVPKGSPWPLAPRWQSSSTLAYALPLANWQVGAALRETYLGHACNAIDCTGRVFGYHTYDLNLSLASLSDARWPELSVSLDNLTDARGVNNFTVNPTLGNTTSYIAPRSLVLRLNGSF